MKKARRARSINKKHHKITQDYDKQKSKHLEKLTDKMLKNDEKAQQAHEYQLSHYRLYLLLHEYLQFGGPAFCSSSIYKGLARPYKTPVSIKGNIQ